MARNRKRVAEKGNEEGYEKLRAQRIKENKERMQKLGIWDLSLKLKLKPKPPPHEIPKILPLPLKTLAPVSYVLNRKRKSSENDEIEIRLEEVWKPEINTEEHEMLLGDCELSWTLLVDGYGTREFCHQRRLNTLGRHKRCSKCKLVQGQLCGDCLYARYGENVIEVNQNPNWICPVCRGICNCSLCRRQKGWRPTGPVYRKVKRLGFKSVAHYLIQTSRSQLKMESLASAESSAYAGSPHSLLNEAIDIDEDPDGFPRPLGEECEGGEQEEKEVQRLDCNNDGEGADTDGKLN
ncbi:hypothetical protein CRYUN_Cryun10bG0125200 [Craigia yunnanensis]